MIQAKDVSLMSKESTYSNAMKLDKNFYLQKGILDVIKTPKKPNLEGFPYPLPQRKSYLPA